MARTKEFDREAALEKAMMVFWAKGFAGTSTQDLLDGMSIGRQSMYDTFGDKHSLYLATLEHYMDRVFKSVFRTLHTAPSPLDALRRVLISISEESDSDRQLGCMGVNSTTEFGTSDPAIVAFRQKNAAQCEALVLEMVEAAQAAGQLPADLKALSAARFILLTRSGLRVSAKSGASTATLQELADFAIQRLQGVPL